MEVKTRLAAVALGLVFALRGQPGRGTDEAISFRMNEFASEYNLFAAEMNGGKFNLGRAKRLSKLWREVETSGTWPRAKGE